MSREGDGKGEEPGAFLARWSRRKRLAAREPAGPRADDEAASPLLAAAAEPEPVGAEPPFDISQLPTLEAITGASDIRMFLERGVPEALTNAALRKAWALDPFLKDHIGPAEYAWDFNDPNAMPGFGPIDPATDVEAMMRQVMGEVPLGAVEDAAPAGDSAHGAAGSDNAAMSAPAGAGSTPEWPGATSGAMVDDAAWMPPDAESSAGVPPVPARAAPAAVARKPRHGSALPE